MRTYKIFALVCLLACMPGVIFAASATATARFLVQVPGTDREIPVTSATISDLVWFRVQFNIDDGEHSLQISIYDGKGKQVYDAESTLVAEKGKANNGTAYGYKADHDAPGIWWYVAAVDGKVLVSSSLKVNP
jgi:hypothetical protein